MTEQTSLKAIISQCHQELNQLFFLHQEAVLIGELPRAIETLHQFTKAHKLHKTFEDDHLLTRLAELADPGDWPPSLYRHEHNKIDDMLSRVEESVVRISASSQTGTALRIEIIELLDREKSFKGVCEHHQEREEAGMLPALDKQTESAWRAAIIEPFLKAWHATVQSQSNQHWLPAMTRRKSPAHC